MHKGKANSVKIVGILPFYRCFSNGTQTWNTLHWKTFLNFEDFTQILNIYRLLVYVGIYVGSLIRFFVWSCPAKFLVNITDTASLLYSNVITQVFFLMRRLYFHFWMFWIIKMFLIACFKNSASIHTLVGELYDFSSSPPAFWFSFSCQIVGNLFSVRFACFVLNVAANILKRQTFAVE